MRRKQESSARRSNAVECGDWLEKVDALVDLLYVTYGAAVEMGVDLEPFFDEVHRANMCKVPGEGGGKSRKPEHWVPPDLDRVWRDVYGDAPLPPSRSPDHS